MVKIPNKKKFNLSDLKCRVSNLFRISNFEFRNSGRGVTPTPMHIGVSSRSERGFTLLFAVLVGSLLFGMGIAIANVAVKEIILSSAGKASAIAFFAADTGTECALYWDIVVGKTAPVFPNSISAPQDADDSIRCNNTNIPLTYEFNGSLAATTTFLVSLATDFPERSCVEVKVGKTVPIPPNSGRTTIEARGRNDSDCASTAENPGRVERALRVTY